MTRPFFSIVIPTFNRAADLQLALCSIYNQKFTNYEVVVVDNCSTDNTSQIVRNYSARNIRYYRNNTNIGMIANQKKAMSLAQGLYIFLLGDDDFLLHKNSLGDVYKTIHKYSPGYIRLNYASISFNKKYIFSYNVNKPFKKDYYLEPGKTFEEIIYFIRDSDCYFFSGIIIKNEYPKRIHMVNADPAPWIEILIYVTQKYGGLFIHKRHLLAVWSRRSKISEDHGFYTLIDGRLKAENYLNVVRRYLAESVYEDFLTRELRTIYINLFPAIKISSGNFNLNAIAQRLIVIAPKINTLLAFRFPLIICLITPKFILKIIRDAYLFFCMRTSYIEDKNEMIIQLDKLIDTYNSR